MNVNVLDGAGRKHALSVTVAEGGPGQHGRPSIVLDAGVIFYLDENHAGALVLALQAAIAEVQARAVSL